MADNELKDRYQSAVYWEMLGYNEYGEVRVDNPREIPVRVEEELVDTLDDHGEKESANGLINVGEELVVGSLLWVGEIEDLPADTSPVMQVIEYEEIPDVKERKYDRNVVTMWYRDVGILPTPVITTTVALGRVFETDVALTIPIIAVLGLAEELSVSLNVNPALLGGTTVEVGVATESCSVLALIPNALIVSLSQAIETSQLRTITSSVIPAPTPSSIPDYTVDTPLTPFLTKTGTQTRAGFWSSIDYRSDGTYRLYYIVQETGGEKQLWEASGTDPLVFTGHALLRASTEVAATYPVGTGMEMVGIETIGAQSRFFTGSTSDLTNWSFVSDVTPPQTGSYAQGDIMAVTDGGQIIMKGHDWSDNNYRRRFFTGPDNNNTQELQGIVPDTGDGQHWDVYGMSIFRPSMYGWKSNTQYVALIYAFKITSYLAPPNKSWQYGPIYPIWGTSDDLVTWELPFGVEEAIAQQNWYDGMLFTGMNPIVVDDELLIHFNGMDFEHNEFVAGDDSQTVGLGLARIQKADFEAAFYTEPTEPEATKIWEWNAGDITVTQWNAFVDTLPVSSVPPNKKGSNSLSMSFGDYRIMVPINYQVPEVIADGRLWSDRETAEKLNGNSHCQWAPRGGPDHWSDATYLGPNKKYRYSFEVDFDEGGTSLSRWLAIESGSPDPGQFAILVDLHPGTFNGGWDGSVEPPIGFYVLSGQFRLYARGAIGFATDYTKIDQINWPFTNGVHQFVIEWQVKYDSVAGVLPGASVEAWMDGIYRGKLVQEIGIPWGSSDNAALFTKVGIYGARVAAAYRKFTIEDISE